MLRSILIASSFVFNLVCFAQTKEVEINQLFRYTVPEGKVVELTNTKFHKLILSDGVFRSGSACNAAAYSNPKYLYGISYYESLEEYQSGPKTIGFTFSEINHDHDDVYQVKPYYLLNNDMGMNDLRKSLDWKFSSQKIAFYPGTTLFPSSCIRSIVLTERAMTQNEANLFNKKRAEITKVNEKAKAILAQAKAKEDMEQRAKQEQLRIEKFNNPKSIYRLKELNNFPKIDTTNKALTNISNLIIDKLTQKNNTVFLRIKNPYYQNSSFKIIGQWDTLGNITSLRLSPSNQSLNSIDLKLSDDNMITAKLKVLLKLTERPIVKVDSKSKYVLLEDKLCGFDFKIEGYNYYHLKKSKNSFNLSPERKTESDTSFEKKLKLEQSGREKGKYQFQCYDISFSFLNFSEFISVFPISLFEDRILIFEASTE
ncbi:hypothetical protein [Pedobacter nanyangensis]|uniref:hypothetical protein n=1 Tax=Pedobacter nanyangensis TaxID=1562389 RepID=UPI000DE39539|nr:hypothetical protein [Pedobacter nanyangensis]